MCENCQLFCGLCRVVLYSLYQRLCCKHDKPAHPKFSVLCIGLSGAGKSSLLALISGDDLHSIPPTVGFSIKALLFEDCILDVKELGGGDNVRPYWDRYYEGSQAVIFVVDSASSDEDFNSAKTELHKALAHPALQSVPLLVLANHQDAEGAKTESEMSQIMELSKESGKRQWMIHSCSIVNKTQTEAGFIKLIQVLMGGKFPAEENGAAEFSKI